MKLSLITGGSRGLGRALSHTFEKEGFDVYDFSRSGTSERHVLTDFSSPVGAATIIENKLSDLAKNDYSDIVLINNAGTLDPIGPIAEFDPDSWIDNININLNSAIIASGMFIKYFQNHACQKTIATISSGAAIRAKHGWSLYCAAKAGLDHFCRTLAMEQSTQKHPVDVILIDPGVMDTDMQAKIRSTDEALFPDLERFINMKESGELLEPETVAQKIYEILSGDIENGAKYSV